MPLENPPNFLNALGTGGGRENLARCQRMKPYPRVASCVTPSSCWAVRGFPENRVDQTLSNSIRSCANLRLSASYWGPSER